MRISRGLQHTKNAEMRISREILHLEHIVLKRNAYVKIRYMENAKPRISRLQGLKHVFLIGNAYFLRNTTLGTRKNAYFSRTMAFYVNIIEKSTKCQ